MPDGKDKPEIPAFTLDQDVDADVFERTTSEYPRLDAEEVEREDYRNGLAVPLEQEPDPFDEPTRVGGERYERVVEQEGVESCLDVDLAVDTSALDIEPGPVQRLPQDRFLPARQALPEQQYRDMVAEEISFSRATGYDREQTAVVPLAELARREEIRLQSRESQADAGAGEVKEEDSQRRIPVGEILDVIRAAMTVEEVAGVLVEIVANLVPRVLLLWERKGRLYGFASRGMDLTEVKLLTIELPLGVMQEMCAASLELDSFQGPPRVEGMVGRFFDILGIRPREVLIIPAQVTAQDRWLLYADNREHALPEIELRLLEVICARAGARADLLLDRRLLW
ncbi:MAG: hypothetical protein JXR96_16575 [Deltaproteobacteria bacterium]|nr:hypothetical protein [Deltaproteobacteria bacterium]